MSDFFDTPEPTIITPPEVQEELVRFNSDTDPEFHKSEFWFRFQQMEREIATLYDTFDFIYKIIKMHWDKPEEISSEHLSLIFQVVLDIIEDSSLDQYEITITT